MNANCVICSDPFDETKPISVAKCGHVYHSRCLIVWIGQSETCPDCRARVTLEGISKLYFNFLPRRDLNSTELEKEVLNLKSQLSAKNVELQACRNDKNISSFIREAEKTAADMEKKFYIQKSELLQLNIKSMELLISEMKKINDAILKDLIKFKRYVIVLGKRCK